jgi:hypothetical protein
MGHLLCVTVSDKLLNTEMINKEEDTPLNTPVLLEHICSAPQ